MYATPSIKYTSESVKKLKPFDFVYELSLIRGKKLPPRVDIPQMFPTNSLSILV